MPEMGEPQQFLGAKVEGESVCERWVGSMALENEPAQREDGKKAGLPMKSSKIRKRTSEHPPLQSHVPGIEELTGLFAIQEFA